MVVSQEEAHSFKSYRDFKLITIQKRSALTDFVCTGCQDCKLKMIRPAPTIILQLAELLSASMVLY